MIRRIKNPYAHGPGEFQAASMSDIAFLLLIFFISSTIFASEEGIPLVLPARQTVVTKVRQENVLEIRAYPDGSVVAEGRNIGLAGVRPLVQQRLAQDGKLIVVIVTHPNTAYGLMVDLLDEIKLANCRRISLKTM